MRLLSRSPVRARCPDCASTWTQRSARFCGHCGHALATSPNGAPSPAAGRSSAVGWDRLPRSARVGGTLLGMVVLGAVLVAPATRDALDGGTEVRVPDPGEVAAAPFDLGADAVACRTPDGMPYACVRWLTPGLAAPAAPEQIQVTAGRVIVTDDEESTLRALAVSTGTEDWRHRLAADAGLELLAPIAEAVPVVQGGALHALEVDSGRSRWAVGDDRSGQPITAVTAAPWILTSDGESVAARSAGDGQPVWSRPLTDGQVALLTEHGAFVRDRPARQLLAIHENVAQVRWRVDMPQTSQVVAVTANLVLLVEHGDLVAVDRVTGERRWDLRVAVPTVTDVGETLIVTSVTATGEVRHRAVDTSDGRVRWTRDHRGTVGVGPAVVDDLVLLFDGPASRPMVTAVDLAGGQRRWSVEAPAPADGAVARGEEVVVLTRDGPAGLDHDSGRLRWRLDVGPTRAVSAAPLLVASRSQLRLVEPAPPSRPADVDSGSEADPRAACPPRREHPGGVIFPECH